MDNDEFAKQLKEMEKKVQKNLHKMFLHDITQIVDRLEQMIEKSSSTQLHLIEEKISSLEKLVEAKECALALECETSITQKFSKLHGLLDDLKTIWTITKTISWLSICAGLVEIALRILKETKKEQ